MNPIAAPAEYPQTNTAIDQWILGHRLPKNPLDPWRPYAFLHEEEPGQDGVPVPTSTIFLTNRECPFRCLMCDLWQNTLDTIVPQGAISAQIRYAISNLPPSRQIKLYNAGSFFDHRAIPPSEYKAVAGELAQFDRVIVECHPAFVREPVAKFAGMLTGKLEVAIGLETAHEGVLQRLNKRMTLQSFACAAVWLNVHGIDLRVFILVRPPFMTEEEGRLWACKSLDFAFECGAQVCSLIPTRAGNGAMEVLQTSGDFNPPSLRSVEFAMEYGISQQKGRVFVDLWDIERFHTCKCSSKRAKRLSEMNSSQAIAPSITCDLCDGDAE